jgi:hypothetical protein
MYQFCRNSYSILYIHQLPSSWVLTRATWLLSRRSSLRYKEREGEGERERERRDWERLEDEGLGEIGITECFVQELVIVDLDNNRVHFGSRPVTRFPDRELHQITWELQQVVNYNIACTDHPAFNPARANKPYTNFIVPIGPAFNEYPAWTRGKKRKERRERREKKKK